MGGHEREQVSVGVDAILVTFCMTQNQAMPQFRPNPSRSDLRSEIIVSRERHQR
jgi:hypothetical protein